MHRLLSLVLSFWLKKKLRLFYVRDEEVEAGELVSNVTQRDIDQHACNFVDLIHVASLSYKLIFYVGVNETADSDFQGLVFLDHRWPNRFDCPVELLCLWVFRVSRLVSVRWIRYWSR